MANRFFIKIFLLGLIGSGVSLPRQCRLIRSKRKLQCKFSDIAKDMSMLSIPWDVKAVSLTNNQLTNAQQVADRIGHLRYLTSLDLSYNNIANGLQGVLDKNSNLEEFKMRNNLLRSIDEDVFTKSPKLNKVDLSNNMLSLLPRGLFRSNPRLKMVMLWANNIRRLPEDLFRYNKELEIINLSWNQLSDIPETFFRGLTSLKKVMLWKNQLTCLYSSMFQDNTQLSTLHVAINYIKKVPDKIFDNNPVLEDVRFWSNRIECIPRNTFLYNNKIGYVNLLMGNEALPWVLKQRFSRTGTHNVNKMRHELEIYGNSSCTTAPCEWNPETLTMDCSYRGIESLAGLVEVCEKVRNLNLDGNRLNDPQALPPVMNHMAELRTLSVQDNGLSGKMDPKTFKQNPELSSVDFSRNRLQSVPETTFQSNFILKDINFSDNEIDEIPENLLKSNPEIERFDFSRNRVKELSKTTFQNNRMITTAKLAKNRILKIDEETFKNNEKLIELDLSQNQIEGEMYTITFEHAPELQSLNLAGNRITSVHNSNKEHKKNNRTTVLELSNNKMDEFPLDTVRDRPFLRRLLLDHNRISSIPEGALHKNAELMEIDFSYNRLTDLSTTTFTKNPKLEILRLDHNGLVRLEEGLLHGNIHLRIFSANGNKIQYISENLFLFNIHLEEVRLSDNMMANVPEGLFAPIGDSLRFLTMSKNSLETLPHDSFDANENLESVYLHGNSLSKLPKEEKASAVTDKENAKNQSTVLPTSRPLHDRKTEKLKPTPKEHEQDNYEGFDAVMNLIRRMRLKKPTGSGKRELNIKA